MVYITGNYNTACGYNAGRYFTGGNPNYNVTSSSSVYIGNATYSSANGNTNEIVIGATAIGAGSNTVTLGNTSITSTILRGAITGGTSLQVDNINLNGAVISSNTGAISFDNENLSTTGSMTCSTAAAGTNSTIVATTAYVDVIRNTYACGYKNSIQTLTVGGTWYYLTWYGNTHLSNITFASNRWTVANAGVYEVSYDIIFRNASYQTCATFRCVNGSGTIPNSLRGSISGAVNLEGEVSHTFLVTLTAGDYIQVDGRTSNTDGLIDGYSFDTLGSETVGSITIKRIA
jgi:hypothetical protein